MHDLGLRPRLGNRHRGFAPSQLVVLNEIYCERHTLPFEFNVRKYLYVPDFEYPTTTMVRLERVMSMRSVNESTR